MYGFLGPMCVCAQPSCLESGEGVGSPGTGVTGSCELSCRCWELNSGPLEDQSVLLTVEPSLQPQQSTSRERNWQSEISLMCYHRESGLVNMCTIVIQVQRIHGQKQKFGSN